MNYEVDTKTSYPEQYLCKNMIIYRYSYQLGKYHLFII